MAAPNPLSIFTTAIPLAQEVNIAWSAVSPSRAIPLLRVDRLATSEVKADISTGRSLEEGMTSAKVFPNMMLQMVASGEESGELETMLDKVAEYYEREVDDAVDSLASIIEPFMIVILGLIIGTMVLAMYMPIFKMASVF